MVKEMHKVIELETDILGFLVGEFIVIKVAKI
jgi:hypothetical protein